MKEVDYIGSKLEQFAREHPEKTAIYFKNEKLTYEMFYYNVTTLQAFLLSEVKEGKLERVAICIGNEPLFLQAFFAVITLGAVAIPFNPNWKKPDANQIMKTTKPQMILATKAFNRQASYSFPEQILLENVLKKEHPQHLQHYSHEDSPFYLGFTSGSTGTPKGFIRNHKSWLASFEAGEAAFHFGKDDTFAAPGPLHHSLSLFGATHALHIGASYYLTPSFSQDEIAELIESGTITVLYAVPTMLSSLVKREGSISEKITFLSSGAKLELELKDKLQRIFPNSMLYEYYGASELSYVTYTNCSTTERFPDSVGKPFPGVEAIILDEEENHLPDNEIGNIYIKSDFLFNGYVNDEKATNQVLTAHGATIGDIGYVNEDGYLFIVGRKDNMMIRGGHNIYPEEIEKVILESGMVEEVVVAGKKDLHWGEKVIALLKWKEKENTRQLRAFLRNRLARDKRPQQYYSVKEFPYTETGKIARKRVEKELARWVE